VVDCKIGPSTREGQMLTTSSPVLFAKSRARSSASVFE